MNWRQWLLCWVLCLGSLAFGQSFESISDSGEPSEGPPPPTGVLDRSGILQKDPKRLANIVERLRRLREEHNYLIYLVVEPVLVQGNGSLKAMELRQKWIPNGNGLVFVYETDSRRTSVGQQFEQSINTDGATTTLVPSFEINSIFSTSTEGMNQQTTSSEEFLETFITRITDGVEAYFQRRDEPANDGRSVRLIMVIIGAAAILLLFALGAAWLMRRSDRGGGGRPLFFPETDAEERLGAPYGGGKVSSRRFGTGAGPR